MLAQLAWAYPLSIKSAAIISLITHVHGFPGNSLALVGPLIDVVVRHHIDIIWLKSSKTEKESVRSEICTRERIYFPHQN
ncbi:hypothetical protein FJD35_15055 [Pseudomonas mandelii]|jgi:hypothetical protein|nr:hypothetical protein FJD35_15055 [Pseudomonas mandelii]